MHALVPELQHTVPRKVVALDKSLVGTLGIESVPQHANRSFIPSEIAQHIQEATQMTCRTCHGVYLSVSASLLRKQVISNHHGAVA